MQLEVIEQCLQALQKQQLLVLPTYKGWCMAADATQELSAERLRQFSPDAFIEILVADERQLMQNAVNLDLSIFDFLEAETKPISIVYQPVIGIADVLLSQDASAIMHICMDVFCKTILKRYRKPLACIAIPHKYHLVQNTWQPNFPEFVGYVVPPSSQNAKNFARSTVYVWNNGQPILQS